MRRLRAMWTAAGIAAGLGIGPSCRTAEDKSLVEPQKTAKTVRHPGDAAVAAATLDADLFSYSPVGKRDPFRSYLSELAEQNSNRHPERKLEATEFFELDQYHLTGLITGISQPKAMIEDPDGHGHVVHIGSRVGKNSGLVAQISGGSILIIEETHDATGQRVQMPVTLKLVQTEIDTIANH